MQMLLYHAECDQGNIEYVQAVYALLRADPEAVVSLGTWKALCVSNNSAKVTLAITSKKS